MKQAILTFLILINLGCIYAQDTSTMKYLPLKIGNTWVYRGWSATLACHGSEWYDSYKITGITQISGKTFFVFDHTRVFVTGQCGWTIKLFESDLPIRVDSLNFNIYKNTACGSSNEMLVDSLKSKLGDTSSEYPFPQGQNIVCTDTSLFTICGSDRSSKAFTIGGWESFVSQRYAKNIGLVSYLYYCSGSYDITLRGCVIDGVVCGDTAMPVGIRIISSQIPVLYQLFQNYPNPFNPTTKIRFDVPSVGAYTPLRLVIYDLLGRKIATLVNQQLKPGTYGVEWDASNYPSGVYFYKLQTESFSETKRMILLK